jgi:hypothetical protein
MAIRKRNYKREYSIYHAKPDQKKRRAARNTARNRAVSSGQVSKGSTSDVHHKDRNPKNNSKKNLSVVSRSTNRSHQGGSGRGNRRYGK